ncbi:DNA primase/helicase [Gordonia phage Mahdia]|uniref:DNA primase/helicase n=1 Tax=Gordonia phage Mahdia TaxID=2047873 RepID=A0A2H4P9Y1_9CAUD|nr:DNA polymerase/primase [Gordonia phage Mahdia]ATW59036.1 DNA primase/helicase [Gordonia phage Mahdia]
MLGSSKLTALLGSAPRADADNTVLKAYAKTLQNDAGLALFLVVPDGKVPAECRTTQAKNKAIKEAEAAGDPKPTGLHMATHNATHLGRWIDKYRKDREPDTPVNMAMEVGRSRLVVIDVDTVAELDAFRQTWAERSGDPALAWVAPTVSSPGVQDPETGEWVHRGGGHFYLRLPEGLELPPETPSTLTYGEAGSQWVARIKDAYVLIPPSQRKEGTYWVSGTDHAIPDWLLADILGNAEARGQRRAERAERAAKAAASGDVDEITAWTQATPWDDILEAAGWTPAGRADGCTCDIWTRPGNNPSPKSATAHNSGCSDPRMNPDSPPIHVWSDNVEGGLADWVAAHGKTLSKLQFIAAVHHGGDIVKAMESVGITPEGENSSHGEAVSSEDLASQVEDVGSSASLADQLMEDPEPVAGLQAHNLTPAGMFSDPGQPAEASDTASSDDADTAESSSSADAETKPRLPLLASFNHWRDLPAPEYVVDGWVEDLALSAVIGPSGVGKSAVVLDMACSIAMGVPWQGKNTKRSRVLYIAGEGGTGAAQRVKSWESEHDLDVGEDLFMITEAVLIGSKNKELWPWLAEQVQALDIRLVIFDTLARMSLGLEENSASDMGNAVARFDRLRRDGKTGVMVVHHTARGQSHGRGSTAILGALDSEILVSPPEDEDDDDQEVDGPGKRITATVTKQKNAADGEAKDLTLCQRHGSIVVADATGATGDPFAAPVLEFVRPAPETDTELAVRLAEYLEPLPMQGATVTDMARDVVPSKAYRNNPSAWRAAVLRAKDRGLATALIQTFGPDGSQRFIKGTATPSQAYAVDRAEAADKEVIG